MVLEREASPGSGTSAERRGAGSLRRELEGLRRDLSALVDEDRRQRLEREVALEREQRELAELRSVFDDAAASWMEKVVPRLRMLLELLPAAGTMERADAGWKVTVTFPWSPDFPVVASLSVEITPVDRYRAGRIGIEPLLIPMLEGHPRASGREFEFGGGTAELARFLDQGVLAFARSYLRVRDPESPYQRCRVARAADSEGFRLPDMNGKPTASA